MADQPKGQGLLITCENGHKQQINTPDYDKEAAETLGAIMDGTSPIYKYPPREFILPGSSLARCGRCSAWINAKTFGYE